MWVSYLPIAKKEAIKLGADDVFLVAIKTLIEVPCREQLLKLNNVRGFKGGTHKGAYEIKTSCYRSVFVLILNNIEVLVIGFFKKESQYLKRTELKTIKQRLKQVKREYEI